MRETTGLDLYASNDTRATMVAFIREHFSDMLGPHTALLEQPGGLDLLADMVRSGQIGPRHRKAA